MLGVALMIMASFSVYLTSNVLDHITPSPYMNLFKNLIYLRLILYYGFGVQCLAWYHSAFNDVKRECVESERKRIWGNARERLFAETFHYHRPFRLLLATLAIL